MKTAVMIIAVTLLLGCGFALFSRLSRTQAQARKPVTPPAEIFEGLRDQALRRTRQNIGLPPPANPSDAWGVVMDWVVTNGTATIVAVADGSASIYLSSGGGFIGGGGHAPVRNAAQRMVAAAVACQQHAHPTNAYPLPERGTVYFYLLTDDGVLTASASEADLRNHQGPLAALGDAGQNVITQYQLIQK